MVKRTARTVGPTPLQTALRSDAAAAAELLHQAFEQAVAAGRAGSVNGLDCRAGCAHCCFGFVTLRAAEAFRLARAIRSMGAERLAGIRDRVLSLDRATRGRSVAQRAGDHVRCPLLGADGGCMAYEARPLACRVFVSFDVKACKRLFAGLGQSVPLPQGRTEAGAGLLAEFDRAAASIERESQPYELIATLAIILTEDAAEQRWLDGQDVLQAARPRPQQVGGASATVQPLG